MQVLFASPGRRGKTRHVAAAWASSLAKISEICSEGSVLVPKGRAVAAGDRPAGMHHLFAVAASLGMCIAEHCVVIVVFVLWARHLWRAARKPRFLKPIDVAM